MADRALNAILVAAWDARCAACGDTLAAPTRGPVCGACWQAVTVIQGPCCARCGVPLFPLREAVGPGSPDITDRVTTTDAPARRETPTCETAPAPASRPTLCGACLLRESPAISRARAATAYEGACRRIIHALKYRGHRSLAAPLARLMLEAQDGVLDGADLVVPVPLHASRTWTRGFNQAALLARRLPVHSYRALRRPQRTRAQAALTAAGRARNLERAFAPSWRLRAGDWLARRVPDARGNGFGAAGRWLARRWTVTGRTVVLVDDVRTTGATLDACARVLLAHGAREVRALTAALVPRRWHA